MLSIRLDKATEADIRREAERSGQSVSDFVRSVLRKDLADRARDEAPWARFIGCGSSNAHAGVRERGHEGAFATAVDEKFERIDRERAQRRAARDAD